MSDFDALWKSAVRFRRVSRELEALMRDVHAGFTDVPRLAPALERLLVFLSSEAGRTDANCSITDAFISSTESSWSGLPEELRLILDDMGGTLHDSVYAPDIARTFDATPEQLLERVRALT